MTSRMSGGMSEQRVRGVLLLVGVIGIGVTAWLKDHELAPGIVGALLLAAALGLFGTRRGPRK